MPMTSTPAEMADFVPSRPGVVIVQSLEQALEAADRALAQGLPLHLESAAGAGNAAGFGWFAALLDQVAQRYPTLTFTACFDCDDRPATAIGAMRRGLRHIRFSGSDAAYRRLAEIAAAFGAEIEHSYRH